MSENYVDLFSTTVSNSGSGYTAGAASLKVVSTTGLTASCTVLVMSASLPHTPIALLHVTAVTNSTTLAVTNEGLDGNAADGDLVYAVISKRALDAIKTDIVASVPGFSIWPSSSFTVPATAGFTWTNQGSASTTDKTDRMIVQVPQSGTNQIRLLVSISSLPSTPYTIDLAVTAMLSTEGSHGSSIGLFLKNSGGNTVVGLDASLDSGTTYFRHSVWTSTTSQSTANSTGFSAWPTSLLFTRITDDGTTRSFYYSANGRDYALFASEATNTTITPNQYGVYFQAYSGLGLTEVISIQNLKVTGSILSQFA